MTEKVLANPLGTPADGSSWKTKTLQFWGILCQSLRSSREPGQSPPATDLPAELWGTGLPFSMRQNALWLAATCLTLFAASTNPAAFAIDGATPVASLKVKPGFKVELLYSVPKEQLGSWVSMCTDPKGRLIVCDQYGGLYRVTVPPIGSSESSKSNETSAAKKVEIEKIDIPLGEAQGLLWAFDSLYVVVNSGGKYESGFYRVTDANHDDKLDTVEKIRTFPKAGEHGPHAVLLAPDGKSLTVLIGNQVPVLPELAGSKVPRLWGEDHLLPRMPDGRGFMKGVMGPGGSIYEVSPDGKTWTLQSTGYRNQYDAAYNQDGELFTYDADMEWDWNTPWYRPTRVCHAVSGAEFGWRNGAGKWPAYYPDSLGSVVNIGPGSPTGVCSGQGAKFPADYQKALFICDWSYGKLYAVHLSPKGASYAGKLDELVAGSPLPLTDVLINPHDGAMYFTIGGRKTQSGLYRVTYIGKDSTAPVTATPQDDALAQRQLRKSLEALHGKVDAETVKTAWPHLASEDRAIRWAARVAIEHQPLESWQEQALAENSPASAIPALLALTRAGGIDPFHRKESDAPVNKPLGEQIAAALDRISWDRLSNEQKVDLCRVYEILFNRFGYPNDTVRQQLLKRLEPAFPSGFKPLDAELANLLVYLQSPQAANKIVAALGAARTQEEQIEYARALRVLKEGWTTPLRESYFKWFGKAAGYRGGASFSKFVENIRKDSEATLTDAERTQLKPILDATPTEAPPAVVPPRAFVKEWSVAELAPLVSEKLTARNFDKGRELFAGTSCFACHRFDGEGGAYGPDLTMAGGRFSAKDLLESIIEPSKAISDQYEAVTIVLSDGRSISGRIANHNGESFQVMTNMLEPNNQTGVKRADIEEIVPSKISMMPAGLINTCNVEEAADLIAYILSKGQRDHAMFAGKPSGN